MSTSVSRRASAPVHPTRQQLEELDMLLKRMLDLPVSPAIDETEEAAFAAPPTGGEAPLIVSPPEPMRGPHPSTFARPAEPQTPPDAVNYQTPDAEEADLHPRVVPSAPDASRETAPAAPPPPAAEQKSPEGAGDWVPLTSSWRPSARTWKPLSDAWQQAQVGNGDPPAAPPWVRDISAAPSPEPPAAPPAPPRQEAPPPAPSPAPMAAPPAEEPVAKRVAPSPRVVEQAKHWKPALPSTANRTPWTLWPLVGFNAAFDACLLPWGPLGRWLRGPTGRSLLGILGLLFLTAAASWAAAEWIGWTR